MKKVIYISYAVCAIAMFALLFYMFDHLRVIESNTREDNEYTQLQPYRTWVVKDSGAPIGVSKVFQLKETRRSTREGYTREILLEEPVDKDGTILLCIRRIPARF